VFQGRVTVPIYSLSKDMTRFVAKACGDGIDAGQRPPSRRIPMLL
jgi:hypothetical protein